MRKKITKEEFFKLSEIYSKANLSGYKDFNTYKETMLLLIDFFNETTESPYFSENEFDSIFLEEMNKRFSNDDGLI